MKNINTKLSFTSFRLMYLSFQASTIWWTFLTTIALVRSGFRPKKLNAVAMSNTICDSGRYFFVPSTSFRWKKCFCSGNKLLKRKQICVTNKVLQTTGLVNFTKSKLQFKFNYLRVFSLQSTLRRFQLCRLFPRLFDLSRQIVIFVANLYANSRHEGSLKVVNDTPSVICDQVLRVGCFNFLTSPKLFGHV